MVSRGLDFGTVGALLPGQPKFSLERAAAGHRNSHFGQYKTGLNARIGKSAILDRLLVHCIRL